MGDARDAGAPVIMNSASNAKNNPVSHSWLRGARGQRPPDAPAHHAPLPSARDSSRSVRFLPGTSPRAALSPPTVLPLSMNRNLIRHIMRLMHMAGHQQHGAPLVPQGLDEFQNAFHLF